MKSFENIITQKVLNEQTGELEPKVFYEVKHYSNKIKQGYRRMYTKYDSIQLAMSSPKELEIMLDIRDMYSKEYYIVGINQTKLAKKHNVSRQKISSIVKKLCDNEFIRKEMNGVYRLNPYVYLPYNADGHSMQKAWDERTEHTKLHH
jgi:predicted transcriptional regulator